jgi:DNA-binding MarR family transcriptional regulator
MPQSAGSEDSENARIVLGLLESVERDGAQSQRKLASDLGIALGLLNAHLRRFVKKGLLKIGRAPARRYAYYLTPHGFAEKSRLTVEYLSSSFSFFRRRAKIAPRSSRPPMRAAGIASHSSAYRTWLKLRRSARSNMASLSWPWWTIDAVPGGFDALVITDLQATRE